MPQTLQIIISFEDYFEFLIHPMQIVVSLSSRFNIGIDLTDLFDNKNAVRAERPVIGAGPLPDDGQFKAV